MNGKLSSAIETMKQRNADLRKATLQLTESLDRLHAFLERGRGGGAGLTPRRAVSDRR